MKASRAAFVFLLFSVACLPSKKPTTEVEPYEEDLSYLRKEEDLTRDMREVENAADDKLRYADVDPQFDIKNELDSVVRIIQESRSEVAFLNGYTVQIYAGPSREVANEIKKKIYEYSDLYEPEVSYLQPNFKVKIGRFFDRLEANKVFVDIKNEFPNAIVIPERIYFK